VGTFAIPLGLWRALALRSVEMPAFECLAIAFAVGGWLVLAFLLLSGLSWAAYCVQGLLVGRVVILTRGVL
jgi:hypothetical protein